MQAGIVIADPGGEALKLPRMKLSSLCVVVGLVAVNLGWLRFLFSESRSLLGFGFGELDLGVLAMLDVLVLAFYRLHRGPFRVGFEIGGLASVFIFTCLCRFTPKAFAWNFVVVDVLEPINVWLADHLPTIRWSLDEPQPPPVLYLVFATLSLVNSAILAAPMVLFASACGLATRFIMRRARPTPLPA